MSGRLRRVSSDCRTPLISGWSLCGTAPGRVTSPMQWAEFPGPDPWLPILEPGTVAAALRGIQRWSLDGPARRFDAEDWWFRLQFDAPGVGAPQTLAFGGLAGHAEAWLNSEPLLHSTNMFMAHECVAPMLRPSANELMIRFASLDAWLAQRRARPRWRAPMVEHQQLRWARTSLLGHVPGWAPPVASVGPWRGVELIERREGIRPSDVRLHSRVDGCDGVVTLSVTLAGSEVAARFELERAGMVYQTSLTDGLATLVVPDAELWWPHTHGEPALYSARLVLHTAGGDDVMLGRIGFRHLELDTAGGDFALKINHVPVFCRGACWMPLDVVSLRSTPQACRAALEQVRDAGMNMLRVSGTTCYEEDHFHDQCDELGILVWQDFMFANMDFPHADAAFSASVRAEVVQQLQRWQARPSLAVLCGNSEAEQQAAMWGSPRENWGQPEFDRQVAELIQVWCPGVPYWPSSAHGGSFPHQNDQGTTSYYGVGAYLRPLEDARRAGLRFATECLALANVPPSSTLARMPGGTGLRAHHPGWKTRSPRDLGAGWDFDDVRDHYLRRLYGLDPFQLRATDPERYLAFSRAVSAELMSATFGEWRRGASACRGAIVWFLRDLWAGAGWGLVDERGVPKAAYHGVKRACAPVAAFISDEGTNGVVLHVVNERSSALDAHLDVALYRDDGLCLQRSERRHAVPARGAPSWNLAEWFDGFLDVSHAYRFGPAEHALVVATVRDVTGVQVGEAFYFPEGLPSARERDIGLSASVIRAGGEGPVEVLIQTRGFAQSVHFDVPGFVAEDEFFHLAPGSERRVRLMPLPWLNQPPARPRGTVLALNSASTAALKEETAS